MKLIYFLLWILNIIVAIINLIALLLPYVSPTHIATIHFLAIIFIPIVSINLCFFLFWLFTSPKKIFLSLSVLVLSINTISKSIRFNNDKINTAKPNENLLSVMSFNVRLMNRYNWIKSDSVEHQIIEFINKNKPNIITLQEYYNNDNKINYPYQYDIQISEVSEQGLAIFTTNKVINKEVVSISDSNKFIYVDIIHNKDTIRVYNIHLASFGLKLGESFFGFQETKDFLKRLNNIFIKQANEVKKITEHIKSSPYKNIICGDLNNTSHSWAYSQLAQNMKDAFIEKGFGFGRTLRFIYPLRIDVIFCDKLFDVIQYKKFHINYSDHFPIMALININSNKK